MPPSQPRASAHIRVPLGVRRRCDLMPTSRGGPDCIEEEDAADDLAVFEHVVIVVAPLPRRARYRSACEDQRLGHQSSSRRSTRRKPAGGRGFSVGRVAVGARHPRRPAVARVFTIPWANRRASRRPSRCPGSAHISLPCLFQHAPSRVGDLHSRHFHLARARKHAFRRR
jgi:hypothetical protein